MALPERLRVPIGRGQGGSIFRGENRDSNPQQFALKALNKVPRSWNGEFREALLLEQVQKGGGHPNVMGYLGKCIGRQISYGYETRKYALRMELLQGYKGLQNQIRLLDLTQDVLLGVQLARGIDYINAQGVRHNDVKPGNLMIDERLNLKICDFGSATTLNHREDLLLGSPAYMARERFYEYEPHQKADQISFGVTLLEILTNRIHEFPEDFRIDACNRNGLFRDETKFLRNANLSVLEPVFTTIFARNPFDRFDSCTEAMGAISTTLGFSYKEVQAAVDGITGVAQV